MVHDLPSATRCRRSAHAVTVDAVGSGAWTGCVKVGADFLQAKDDITELSQHAFGKTPNMINERVCYDDHTDET